MEMSINYSLVTSIEEYGFVPSKIKVRNKSWIPIETIY